MTKQRFDRAPSSISMQFDLDEVVMFMDTNMTEIGEMVAATVAASKASKVPAAVHAAALLLAARAGADPDRLASWLDGITTGADLPEGDPRLALRRRFMQPYTKRTSDNPVTIWYCIVTALNADLVGDQLLTIQPRKDIRIWPFAGEDPAAFDRRSKSVSNRRHRAKRRPNGRSRSSAGGDPVALEMAAAG